MEIKLNSPQPSEFRGPKGEKVHKMVITVVPVPVGEMYTIQYFAEDGTLLRQDKECNVREGVVSMGEAKL